MNDYVRCTCRTHCVTDSSTGEKWFFRNRCDLHMVFGGPCDGPSLFGKNLVLETEVEK